MFTLVVGAASAVGLMLTLVFSTQRRDATVVTASHPASLLAGETTTLLPDGRWLMIGGKGAATAGPLPNAVIWDQRTNVTTPLPNSLQHPRAWHTATVLPDGNVLILGGLDANGEAVSARGNGALRAPHC